MGARYGTSTYIPCGFQEPELDTILMDHLVRGAKLQAAPGFEYRTRWTAERRVHAPSIQFHHREPTYEMLSRFQWGESLLLHPPLNSHCICLIGSAKDIGSVVMHEVRIRHRVRRSGHKVNMMEDGGERRASTAESTRGEATARADDASGISDSHDISRAVSKCCLLTVIWSIRAKRFTPNCVCRLDYITQEIIS